MVRWVWVLGFVWVSDGGAGEGLFVVQCVCVWIHPSIRPPTIHPSNQPTNQPIHPSIKHQSLTCLGEEPAHVDHECHGREEGEDDQALSHMCKSVGISE